MKPIKNRAALLFLVSFYVFLLLPLTPLWAQGLDFPADADLFAPVIQHEPPTQAISSESPFRFQAKVTDNIGVGKVTLFYRKAGEEVFASMKMSAIGEENYAATIAKEHISNPGFEYYIQAGDKAGNTALRGFSFAPLVVAVSPALVPEKVEEVKKPPAPKKAAPVLTEEFFPTKRAPMVLSTGETLEKPWYKKWWVWTIALVLVGGGIAAGSGGGGGDSAGAPTGSVAFSGTAP